MILVDDGSGEAYRELFRKAEEILQEIGGRLLTHEKNKGKGGAIRTAFAYVLEKYPEAIGVVTADCDGQHHVEDILAIMRRLSEKPDCLIAGVRRFDGEDVPWKSAFGNKLTAKVVSYIRGSGSATPVLTRHSAELHERASECPGDGFEYDTRMLGISRNTRSRRSGSRRSMTQGEPPDPFQAGEGFHTDLQDTGSKIYHLYFCLLSSSVVDIGLFALFCRLSGKGSCKCRLF